MHKRFLGIVIFSLVFIVPAYAFGASYYVSTSGNDSTGNGSILTPWRTVNFAVGRLNVGDTLNIRGGMYTEKVTVARSGTVSAPIVIQSYPGEQAVIDSGPKDATGRALFQAAGNNDWVLHNAAIGEWKSAQTVSSGNYRGYIAGIAGYENERVGLVPYVSASHFRATTDGSLGTSLPSSFYIGPGTFYDSSDSRVHIRLSKTYDMQTVEQRYGQVFPNDGDSNPLNDNIDPRNYSIILSQASETLIVNAAYVTVKDLTVHQGTASIRLGSNASNVIFDGITAWMGDDTINGTGSLIHDITIKNSRIYGDWPQWVFWSDMKDAPAPADLMRGTSIEMGGGTYNWTIMYNHIRGAGQDLVGVNDDENNIIVHHNRMENCGDDAFELEGTTDMGRIEMYENYIANCLVAVALAQDTTVSTGPFFFYRNTAAFLRNVPVNRVAGAGLNTWNGDKRYGFEYMFKQGGTGYKTGNIQYTHNTLVMLNTGSGHGLNFTRMNTPGGSTIANNLAVMVLGNVNKNFPSSGSGAFINGDLYWKVIPRITGQSFFDNLLGSYTTVPAFSAATGYEQNGKGGTAYEGTNPGFANLVFPALSSETDPIQRKFLNTSFEKHNPADFLLSLSSVACGGGVNIQGRMTTNLNGATPEPVRDSRGFDNDLGAIPCGTSASAYDFFPFVISGTQPQPDTTPPTAPTNLHVVSVSALRDNVSQANSLAVTTEENNLRDRLANLLIILNTLMNTLNTLLGR